MAAISKKLTTSVTFRDSLSTSEDIRFLKLTIESEGAGRFLVLTDHTHGCTPGPGRGWEVNFYSPDDIKQLYDAAVEIWEQGDLYFDGDL
jgi:hypothetical protein